MSVKSTVDAEIGLQFFGKMTASISHEIKNVLAIINENAGLLEDLALLAGRGAAIDPQRLTNMSQAVMKQVKADIAYLYEEMQNRLYAPGGVISQTIYVTEPVRSPKIYEENGEIVLQTVGSGNVILSAATGLQLYGQQVVIESTNTLNPLIYLDF